MRNMKKKDIKDIVHQMICMSMDSFDCSFEDSIMNEEDKEYAFSIFKKYQDHFHNKVKNSNLHLKANVSELVNIASYKDRFIKTILDACGDKQIANFEYEGFIESMGKDMDYSSPEEDAKECMSYWSE